MRLRRQVGQLRSQIVIMCLIPAPGLSLTVIGRQHSAEMKPEGEQMGHSDGARADAADPAGPALAALRWLGPPEGPAIELLDQTRLPAEEVFLRCGSVPELVDAISRLVVRGAPLLGVAGAFGVALAAYRGDDVAAAAAAITAARPTAVNLGWGVRRALQSYRAAAGDGGPVPSGESGRPGGTGRSAGDCRARRRRECCDGRARTDAGARWCPDPHPLQHRSAWSRPGRALRSP